jgi:membrane-bound lytic murein transglycosylase D
MRKQLMIRRFVAFALFLTIVSIPFYTMAQTNPGAADTPFPLLSGLEKQVQFWKRVFTEFSTSQLIFFDAADMSNIYEVLHVGAGSRPTEYINAEKARIAAERGIEIEQIKVQRGIKERTAAGLKRSGRYISQMQEIFRERGLPMELTYLPIVESSYDLTATSSVGAAGIWQFMRATAKQFKLRIDRFMDERRDPLESTRAAAALLAQNYQSLGNWPLALTAYNYGPAGMARAVSEIGSDNLVDLIERYEHPNWGFAAKNFYAEFLAAVEIGKNINQYFPGLEFDAPTAVKEVEFKSGASLAAVLNATGMTQTQFYQWNPAFASPVAAIPAGYRVKVPADVSVEPVSPAPQLVKVQSRPSPSREEPFLRHRVKRGETLQQIAVRYGSSIERILKLNGIRKPSLVQAGTTLRIPKA